jgi:hypothetical protein
VSEPWVNFSDTEEEVDHVILLRPDRKERLHIYRRPNGTFGRRNFVWIADEYYQGWTVGAEWGHVYDSVATALREARGAFAWVAEQLDA